MGRGTSKTTKMYSDGLFPCSSRSSAVLFAIVWLSAGCLRHGQPFGKPPDYFFQDALVLQMCSAILGDDIEALKIALDAGADVNLKGRDGMTPLLWTFETRNKKAFESLLAKGANPNLQTADGDAVMGMAITIKDPFYLKTALKHGGNPSLVNPDRDEPLVLCAISERRFDHLEALVAAGADLNWCSRFGGVPLLINVVEINRYDTALYLLTKGADPTKATANGDTFVGHLREDMCNPGLRRTGGQWEIKGKIIDILAAKGIDVTELRQIYANPPDVNAWMKERQAAEVRGARLPGQEQTGHVSNRAN